MARLAIEQFQRVGDDLAPNFDIAISGKDASGANELYSAIRPLIASVAYEDDEEMSSLFELTVINQPDTSYGMPVDWRAVIDSKAFAEGNTVDLWMGYGASRVFMDRVEIVKWLPSFSENGPTTFTIKGFDGRHKMMQGNQFRVKTSGNKKRQRKTFFKNTPDESIVKKIAEKYGYGVDVDITEIKKQVKTRVQGTDLTDWQFLQKLADINRFDLWVDWSESKKQHVIHFKERKDTGAAGYLFEYNGGDGSLLSADPDFNIHDQPTDVEVLYYDKKKRAIERTIISDATPAENVKLTDSRIGQGQMQAKKELTVGARVRFSAFDQNYEAFSNKPFKSKKAAARFVQNWIKEREREFLIMQGKVVGVPTLRSRQIHEIRGLGKRLDGLYRFTNVKHVMAPGQFYNCEFTAHKVVSQMVARGKPTTTVQVATDQVQQAG